MGRYINKLSNGKILPRIFKASFLIRHANAEQIYTPIKWDLIPSDKALICVVDNVLFDAAAYAYCYEEANIFAREDGREKTWLLMDKEEVEKIAQ